MVTAVAPQGGVTNTIATGGTAVTVAVPPINGCYIVNPALAADQGLAATEPLYVDPVNPATLQGRGTTTALAPGQSYNAIPGQIGNLSVNAATSGHQFVVVRW